VLFGDVNPAGRLPITFPRRLADNPAHINFPGENGKVHYGEGLFVGYRYYDKKEIEPLFPFGHGLAYTDFSYASLRLGGDAFQPDDTIQVQVDVTNSGDRAGAEVVQLYLGQPDSRLVRPPQELKGFARVTLEPGETRTVTLPLTPQSRACYDPQAGAWASEPGPYTVRIGRSSRDIRLQASFTVSGDDAGPQKPDGPQLSTVPT